PETSHGSRRLGHREVGLASCLIRFSKLALKSIKAGIRSLRPVYQLARFGFYGEINRAHILAGHYFDSITKFVLTSLGNGQEIRMTKLELTISNTQPIAVDPTSESM